MKRLRFKKIDAFVNNNSGGNPAGCVYLDAPEDLNNEEMQQIGRELAGCVSEVVFLSFTEGHTTLRFFSQEREVAFCGHGTIAAMYDLIHSTPALRLDPILRIHIGDTEILIKNEIPENDAVFVSAPAPVTITDVPGADAVAAVLKIPPGEIADPAGISIINAGLATLLVPLRTPDTLLAVQPGQANLKEFCIRNKIEIVLIHAPEAGIEGVSHRTRVFAPIFGYLEDPATGSGNAAFGYWLLARGLWDGKILTVAQGRSRESPNIVRLMADASEKQRMVFFGGNAVVRIEGEYLLH